MKDFKHSKNFNREAGLNRPSEELFSKNLPFASDIFIKNISTALAQLSEMENSEKLRVDAIRNGKAIIKNWVPPSDEQIDKIFMNMSNELLA